MPVQSCPSKSCFSLELSIVPHACGCFALTHGVIHFAEYGWLISASQLQSSCILLIEITLVTNLAWKVSSKNQQHLLAGTQV